MIRAAIYARFSSEVQNVRSIEDQIEVCRRTADARGWTVLRSFTDAAISGAAMANRPGLLAALAAAERGEFDVLLAEAEDRVARNLEHLAHVVNRLEYVGVQLSTLSTERVETMHVAFMGAMAQEYLRNLSAKTKRGMHSNAEKGLATGAKLYGYVTQPGGAVSIDQAQAQVVRRICALFADERLGGREIADRLNRDGTPGPRGGYWNASTILGERKRGNGILRSEIYAGVKVWGRDEVKKDPRTGQRVHHYKPPEEWRRTPVEHLRIVPAELWTRVQTRLDETAHMTLSAHGNRRKPGVFSGLLKCACGASYTSYRRRELICASHRERGPSVCANNHRVDRDHVEHRILEGLQERMFTPEAVSLYARAYREAWRRLDRERKSRRQPLERRMDELARQVERLVDAICDGTATMAMRERLVALEAEKAEIEASLGREAAVEAERGAPEPHPNAANAYAAQVRELAAVLDAIQADREQALLNRKLIDAVRGLIVKVEIIPNPYARGGVELRLHGELSRFIKPPGEEHTPNDWRNPLVAGGGIEPPTCGL